MYIPKVETHMFSQRFSEANAVTLQTFLRLHQMGVPRERPDQSHRLLFHRGQTVHILHKYMTHCEILGFQAGNLPAFSQLDTI